MCSEKRRFPIHKQLRLRRNVLKPNDHDNKVQQQIEATKMTAMPIASLNPLRNTAPSSATKKSVIAIDWPRKKCGANGFSIKCALAVRRR
jgi:hypothetical protein